MNKYLKRAFTQDRYYTPERFQHCSTICSFKGGTLVAFYAGDRECDSSQRVLLFWNKPDGSQTQIHEFEDLTGNPMFINTNIHHTTKIIYSEFTKFPPYLAQWWQHCKLWVREIEQLDGELVLGDRKPVIVEEPFKDPPPDGTGYLPRCHPIQFGEETLLPLYREHEPNHHGVLIASKDGINWKYRGSIGHGTRCIQPTIWKEKGKLCALLRNFNRSYGQKAYYSESTDFGTTWSEPTKSQFYNANNSILALECYDVENNLRPDTLFVWNDDPRGRDKICLGTKDKVLIQLDSYGSYPAACLHQGEVHVTYTAKANLYKFPHAKTVIKHKSYNLQQLMRESRRSKTYSI